MTGIGAGVADLSRCGYAESFGKGSRAGADVVLDGEVRLEVSCRSSKAGGGKVLNQGGEDGSVVAREHFNQDVAD